MNSFLAALTNCSPIVMVTNCLLYSLVYGGTASFHAIVWGSSQEPGNETIYM